VSWSPKSNQFIVVYGNIPAKATLFNLKCDAVFDFGTGIRNSIYFNDFGNLVLFGAFGNLRGQIEVWDLTKKKLVSNSQASDTTVSLFLTCFHYGF
jgi:translation initiation factor 2A